MNWLERGVALRSGALPGDGIYFDLEPLRGNARYEALLKKLGMPAEPSILSETVSEATTRSFSATCRTAARRAVA